MPSERDTEQFHAVCEEFVRLYGVRFRAFLEKRLRLRDDLAAATRPSDLAQEAVLLYLERDWWQTVRAALPDHERELLGHLRDDRPVPEIAVLLGVGLATAYRRVAELKKKLHETAAGPPAGRPSDAQPQG